MAARKPRKRAGAEAPAVKRLTVSMPAEQARLLAAYAAWHGRTESQVIAEALGPVLQGFYVATRSGRIAADPTADATPPELRVA
jgi:hypothetical protein